MRFKLLKYYSTASAAVVLIVTLSLAYLFDRYATDNLIHSVEQQNVTLAQIVGQNLAQHLPAQFEATDAADVEAAELQNFARDVDALVRDFLETTAILKIKAFWDGVTIYSTNHEELGQIKDNFGFRQAEQEGVPASKLSFRGEFNVFEDVVANISLVETYAPVPLANDPDDRHRLVVEVYTDVTPVLDDIKRSDLIVGLILILLLSVVYGVLVIIVWRADRVIDQQYESLDAEIHERKIAEQNAVAAEQATSDAMALISESIEYASRIQRAVLPLPSEMNDAFSDHMVIWEPKDIVGGDIYLLRECRKGILIMLMDCTGHGVPGAIMTTLATGAFDHALRDFPDGDPAALLGRTNQLLKMVLNQDGDAEDGDSDDGFEAGLCLIPSDASGVIYAGARFELWQLAEDEVLTTKGENVGIGYRRTLADQQFKNHRIEAVPGTAFCMSSDGLIDQIGGTRRRAHGKRRLKESFAKYANLPMPEQAEKMFSAFREFQGDEARRDDISLVGFRT